MTNVFISWFLHISIIEVRCYLGRLLVVTIALAVLDVSMCCESLVVTEMGGAPLDERLKVLPFP